MTAYEQQYLELCRSILDYGEWIYNARTGKRCLTLPEYTMHLAPMEAPLLTVKQSFAISAAAEILGYLRRYDNAQQFADIGTKTWFQNANETQAWLDNPNRKGENDLGKVYGAALEQWEIDELFVNLERHYDDRGLILNFWRPDKFKEAALRPCMYEHIFSIVEGDGVILNSVQRSCDVPLGLNFNSIQVWFLLNLVGKVTGLQPRYANHKIINAHIYEDQMEGVQEMMSRKPNLTTGQLIIPDTLTISDVLYSDKHARDFISVVGYEGKHQGKIHFPMSS
ncbi:thymidylate synthase [Vibrio phage RYC]|nr:thymidylate synthase [Vibrio phage RYC]